MRETNKDMASKTPPDFQEIWTTRVIRSQRIPSVIRDVNWEWSIPPEDYAASSGGGGHWLLFYKDPTQQDLDWTRLCYHLEQGTLGPASALRTTTKSWSDFHTGRDGMIHVHTGPPQNEEQCCDVGARVLEIATGRSHDTISYKPEDPFAKVLYRLVPPA